MLAQGLADAVAAAGGKSENISSVFKDFTKAIFPFTSKTQETTDKDLTDMMRKEAAKGPITFKTADTNILRNTAKRLSMPDEFLKKLHDSKASRTGRK